MHFFGGHAFEEGVQQKHLARVQASVPAVQSMQVIHCYLVSLHSELAPEASGQLIKLIRTRSPQQPIDDCQGEGVILPQPGHFSAWSYQATKLAHDIGLKAVKRIERGFYFQCCADAPLSESQLTAIVDVFSKKDAHRVADVPAALAQVMTSIAQPEGTSSAGHALLPHRAALLNAAWKVNGISQEQTLSELLTTATDNHSVLTRYPDFGAVMRGRETAVYHIDPESSCYRRHQADRHVTFQLASSADHALSCGLGEIGRGHRVNALFFGILGNDPSMQYCQQSYGQGVPVVSGFWRTDYPVKALSISGVCGTVQPSHMALGSVPSLVYALLDKYESVRGIQNVIEHCVEQGERNPIREIRCTQSEQWVLCIDAAHQGLFERLAAREGCCYQWVQDFAHTETMQTLPVFAVPSAQQTERLSEIPSELDLLAAAKQVLSLPAIADKSFLLKHLDRSVGGLVARDAMVGHWQIPVADVGVTLTDFLGKAGQAMAAGEKAPLSVLNVAAATRMAIGEALTNLAAAALPDTTDISLQLTLCAAADPQDAAAFQVASFAKAFVQELGMSVGAIHHAPCEATTHQNAAPFFVVNAVANIAKARDVVEPRLQQHVGLTHVALIDLGLGAMRLGGSALTQVQSLSNSDTPDIEADTLQRFLGLMGELHQRRMMLAYHDRSDGGLITTLAELMFASRVGLDIHLDTLDAGVASALFCEELGAVIQVRDEDLVEVLDLGEHFQLPVHVIGNVAEHQNLAISHDDQEIFCCSRAELQRSWAEYGYRIAAQKGNADVARREFDAILDEDDPGLTAQLTFDVNEDIAASFLNVGVKPQVAILRQQDSLGESAMAAAFDLAGFECVDVHMNALRDQDMTLDGFKGLAMSGAFSYGDVFGAGRAWAKSIALQEGLCAQFHDFFHRRDTFTLGIANGAQVLTYLKHLIPGASMWPNFVRNRSQRFEARLDMVQMNASPCIFTQGMEGSWLPVVVAHASGQAQFELPESQVLLQGHQQVVMQYIDHHGEVTDQYPLNPDGSIAGINAVTNEDGRILALMPHIDRCFLRAQFSWAPQEWDRFSPWMRIFRNARVWVG